MRSLGWNAIGASDGQSLVIGGRPSFDGQCAFEYEVPIGYRAVKMPRDHRGGNPSLLLCGETTGTAGRRDNVTQIMTDARRR